MADDQETVNTQEAQPEADSSPETNQSEPVEAEQTVDPEASDDTEVQEEADNSQQKESGETRSQRRIKDLVSKLKDKDQDQEQAQTQAVSQSPWSKQNDPFENLPDELTPDQLKQLITGEAYKIANMVNAQNRQQQQYQEQVNNHVSDMESTAEQIAKDFEDDPNAAKQVEELLVQLNENANVETDQYGNRRLVPRIKTSEIYNNLKKTLKRERVNGQAEVTASMAKKIANQSSTPSGKGQTSEPSLEDLRKQMVKDPSAVRKALEQRLTSQ